MSRTFALNKIERKLILLCGDLVFIYIMLQLFLEEVILDTHDNAYIKVFGYLFGFSVFGLISYVLDLYNLERASKTRSILPLSVATGFVFSQILFLSAIITLNSSLHRGILILFLFGSPIMLGLWRVISCKFFVSAPFQRNTIYIYDSGNESQKEERIKIIEGIEESNGYKVKMSLIADNKNVDFDRKIIRESIDKIDALILDIKDYNSIALKIGDFAASSIIRRKEMQTFSSFYENEYEALHFDSDTDSFYKIMQMKNMKKESGMKIYSFSLADRSFLRNKRQPKLMNDSHNNTT